MFRLGLTRAWGHDIAGTVPLFGIRTGAVRNLQHCPVCIRLAATGVKAIPILKRKKKRFFILVFMSSPTHENSAVPCFRTRTIYGIGRFRISINYTFTNPFGRRRRVARFPPPRDKPRRHNAPTGVPGRVLGQSASRPHGYFCVRFKSLKNYKNTDHRSLFS